MAHNVLFVLDAEVSSMSDRLSAESRVFALKAKDLNRQVGETGRLI